MSARRYAERTHFLLLNPDRNAIQAGRQAIANFMVVSAANISKSTSEYEVMLVRSAGYEQSEDPVFYYRFTVRSGVADAPH